jgi:hypothetical protein
MTLRAGPEAVKPRVEADDVAVHDPCAHVAVEREERREHVGTHPGEFGEHRFVHGDVPFMNVC